jgi:hypothetical protein
MKHVIIDRPRVGGEGGKSRAPKGSRKRLQRTAAEDQPKYESTARHRLYGIGCKQLNEHLAPLVRWLRSQRGRSWDDVWSEICDGLSVRKATTAHVRDHADEFVERNCILVDGEVCDSRGAPLSIGWRRCRFYVDPRDNTLREVPIRRRHRSVPRCREWVPGADDAHRFYLLNGIWYEITLEPLPASGMVHDFLLLAWVDRNSCDWYRRYGWAVYAAAKRQLGKGEIRKRKLWETEVGRGHTKAR